MHTRNLTPMHKSTHASTAKNSRSFSIFLLKVGPAERGAHQQERVESDVDMSEEEAAGGLEPASDTAEKGEDQEKTASLDCDLCGLTCKSTPGLVRHRGSGTCRQNQLGAAPLSWRARNLQCTATKEHKRAEGDVAESGEPAAWDEGRPETAGAPARDCKAAAAEEHQPLENASEPKNDEADLDAELIDTCGSNGSIELNDLSTADQDLPTLGCDLASAVSSPGSVTKGQLSKLSADGITDEVRQASCHTVAQLLSSTADMVPRFGLKDMNSVPAGNEDAEAPATACAVSEGSATPDQPNKRAMDVQGQSGCSDKFCMMCVAHRQLQNVKISISRTQSVEDEVNAVAQQIMSKKAENQDALDKEEYDKLVLTGTQLKELQAHKKQAESRLEEAKKKEGEARELGAVLNCRQSELEQAINTSNILNQAHTEYNLIVQQISSKKAEHRNALDNDDFDNVVLICKELKQLQEPKRHAESRLKEAEKASAAVKSFNDIALDSIWASVPTIVCSSFSKCQHPAQCFTALRIPETPLSAGSSHGIYSHGPYSYGPYSYSSPKLLITATRLSAPAMSSSSTPAASEFSDSGSAAAVVSPANAMPADAQTGLNCELTL